MKITVTDGNNIFMLEVDEDQLVEDVKALVQVESGIPLDRIELFFDGNTIKNNQKLNEVGLKDDGLLFFNISATKQQVKPKPKLGIAAMIKKFDKQIKSAQDPGYQFHHRSEEEFKTDAKKVYDQLKADSYRLSELETSHPDMAQAIREGNINQLAKIMYNRNEDKIKKLIAEQKRFIELSKDPMNPEYQKLLQERIHQQNIDKNLEFANQYIPEVFGSVNMLYINASINKVPIQAFVDSGAQSTIMSQSLAERCGLMRLVDKRQAGRAVGVGSCKILGKIHAAEIQIEKKFITCSFTVIQNNSVQFLLGLDMLKRFNCLIDLKRNVLNFQDGLIETRFLSDGQIQKNKTPQSKEDIKPKLQKLMGMGFGKEESLASLQSCNYNEQVAGNILMQKKYGK